LAIVGGLHALLCRMNEILVNIASGLANMVSEATGIGVSRLVRRRHTYAFRADPGGTAEKGCGEAEVAALSMDKPPPTNKGRKIAVLVGNGTNELALMAHQLSAASAMGDIVHCRLGAASPVLCRSCPGTIVALRT
jgi:hypothetical protein